MKTKAAPAPVDDEDLELEGDAETEGSAGRQFISALARGLDVLRAFRPNDPPLSNQELAKRTGFPRPTISRITYTLTELGYLNYHERFGCYELGGGAFVLGHVARMNFNAMEQIRPAMQRLAELSNANVGIGARDRLNMNYLEAVHGPSRIGLRFEVGERIPMISTAMGRAYLAAAPDDEVAAIIKQLKKKNTDDPDNAQRVVELARDELARLGFCSSVGDWHDDIHGIAAPIMAPELGGLLAINIGAPAYLVPKKKMMNEIGPELVKTATEIADIFGRFHRAADVRAAGQSRSGRSRGTSDAPRARSASRKAVAKA
ncbi:MAG: hypothetical protein JWR80_7591 [Bradyrhizobium sp.]|nr:hypothetical protein [Bradyrhizobium sp.]